MLEITNMLDQSNFYQYTLTNEQLKTAATLFTVILFTVSVLGKICFPEQKRLAWCISLVNSGLMTVVGIVYLTVKSSDYDKMWNFEPNGYHLYHHIDNVAVLACLWFGLANIFDLAFGLLFYRKYLGLLTAYIHHSVFIWMMIACTTGNGGFVQVNPFASIFTSMLIEELPTFLLALGSVFPSFRVDIGFGVTFFLFRIFLHGWFFAYAIYSKTDTIIMVLYALTFTMHANWFYTWVTKYGFKNVKQAVKVKEI